MYFNHSNLANLADITIFCVVTNSEKFFFFLLYTDIKETSLAFVLSDLQHKNLSKMCVDCFRFDVHLSCLHQMVMFAWKWLNAQVSCFKYIVLPWNVFWCPPMFSMMHLFQTYVHQEWCKYIWHQKSSVPPWMWADEKIWCVALLGSDALILCIHVQNFWHFNSSAEVGVKLEVRSRDHIKAVWVFVDK